MRTRVDVKHNIRQAGLNIDTVLSRGTYVELPDLDFGTIYIIAAAGNNQVALVNVCTGDHRETPQERITVDYIQSLGGQVLEHVEVVVK